MRRKRGQVLILSVVGIVVVLLTVSTTLLATYTFKLNLPERDFRIIISEISFGGRAALTSSLAEVSNRLENISYASFFQEHLSLDVPGLKQVGEEKMTKWYNDTLRSYPARGLRLNIDEPEFQCEWNNPMMKLGYSRALVNIGVDLLNLGFKGFNEQIVVELNSTIHDILDNDGSNIRFVMSFVREKGYPVETIAKEQFNLYYQVTYLDANHTSIIKSDVDLISHHGGGIYEVQYSTGMNSIIDNLNQLNQTIYNYTAAELMKGPVVNAMAIPEEYNISTPVNVTLIATADAYDVNTTISQVEYIISNIQPNRNDPGTPMEPTDGTFDEELEDANKTIPSNDLVDYTYLWVHAKNDKNFWGDYVRLNITVQGTTLRIHNQIQSGEITRTQLLSLVDQAESQYNSGDLTAAWNTLNYELKPKLDHNYGESIARETTDTSLALRLIGIILSQLQPQIRVVAMDFRGLTVSVGASLVKLGEDPFGPIIIDEKANPPQIEETSPTNITLTATADDQWFGNSNITKVEYIISNTPPEENATGVQMNPVDGSFDEPVEEANATILASDLSFGTNYVWIHAQDSAGNWGDYTWLKIDKIKNPLRIVDNIIITVTWRKGPADINHYGWIEALVTIVDGYGNPVEAATVHGVWSGDISWEGNKTTKHDGTCIFDHTIVKKGKGHKTYTITVDGVWKKGYEWDGIPRSATYNE